MTVGAWLRPPRRVLSLLIGVTIVLGATLAWLGWRLIQQDRALEGQRVRERLESAADRIVTVLRRRLDSADAALTRLAALPGAELRPALERDAAGLGDEAVLVAFTDDPIAAFPRHRLPYYPVVPAAAEPPAQVFSRAESLEFRRRDFTGASAVLRGMARSTDPIIRAGALLRLGRNLRKAHQLDSALAVHEDLARLGDVVVEGLPAALAARFSRLGLLDELGRGARVPQQAESLLADLYAGRWRLSRGSFAFYSDELRRRVPAGRAAAMDSAAAPYLALAAGTAALWDAHPAERSAAGHRTVRDGDRPVFLLWRTLRGRTVALVTGSRLVEREWLGGILAREHARVLLADADGTRFLAQIGGAGAPQALRTPAETQLPWTVLVASADPSGDLGQIGDRRRLLLLGVAISALLVLVGLYAVTRAVSRELEVARLQSDFVAAVSHEFRTPLTSLRQLTELLSSGRVASDERRATYYQVITRESKRLHRLVEGLLDFGRMEAGALEFRMEPLDVARLVTDTVEEFRAEVNRRGYDVALKLADSECMVRADREALSRAVWNLLDNAVKYSTEHRCVAVTLDRDVDRVAIHVRDRGVGIAPDEQNRIFDKFVRGSASEQSGVKGTGIGLAMVRHIVTAHGGEVRVDSQLGAGSTFTILLPVSE